MSVADASKGGSARFCLQEARIYGGNVEKYMDASVRPVGSVQKLATRNAALGPNCLWIEFKSESRGDKRLVHLLASNQQTELRREHQKLLHGVARLGSGTR